MLPRAAACILVLACLKLAAQQTAAFPSGDFQISGTLVNSITGQPVAHARVAIAPVTQRDNFTTITTPEDGRFSFTNLAPGKYTLTAQARGYLLQSFNQHDTFSSSIAVGPEIESGNLVFHLPPESVITGLVTDEAGEPVREAQVMLYFTGLSAGAEVIQQRGGRVMTDEEGAYRFSHLSPGRYLIAVSARPWYARHVNRSAGEGDNARDNPLLDVAYPVTFYGGVTEAGAATRITLSPGDKATADINLQPAPALRIRLDALTGDAGQRTFAIVERRVQDGPPIILPVERRFVSDQGNPENRQQIQEIDGITPGHYVLRAYTAGENGSEWVGSREIDVNASGEIDKDQSLTYVPASATLQFEGGAPARQGYVQLVNKKTRETVSANIDPNNQAVFKQGLLPGSYELSLSSSLDLYVKSISATGAHIIGRTLEIRPGATVKLNISAARGEGQVTGVALRDGKPLAGAMIVLAPDDPAHNQVLFRRDQSDSDGTFTLANVVPDMYTVIAIENGWTLEWMNPEILKKYLGRGTTVRVQPHGKYEVKVNVQ